MTEGHGGTIGSNATTYQVETLASVAGIEWCSCTMNHFPSCFRNPTVNRKSSSTRCPLLVSPHRPIAVANATSDPTVIVTSRNSNITGLACHQKNVRHVAMYSSIPRDTNGGGTSNIST